MHRFLWPVLIVCLGLAACSVNTEATGTGGSWDAGSPDGMAGATGDGGIAGSGGQSNCFPSPTQKFCGKDCPSKDDPAHGCADPSCAACDLPNAVSNCAANGQCGVESCNPGFNDCDSDPSDGCEVNTDNDPHNCGSCGHDCFTPGDTTNWVCNQGTCEVSNCPTGKGDCNKDSKDGCEVTLTSDPKNCAFCGNDCSGTVQHAGATCANGTCGYSSCNLGWANCDGDATNGCEQDVATDPTNCGGCNKVCNSTNGQPACILGLCTIACNPGYGDCKNGPSDGCETNLGNDTAHCGKCNIACSNQHGTTSCSSGTCNPQCSSGYADCDGNKANGCETNTNTSNSNCGGCGTNCTGGRTCQTGTCKCGSNQVVYNNACCTPSCSGKTCGAGDGCGGTCQSGSGCCTPSCSGKTCGAGDGCGGTCQSGSGCCTPSCSGKTCGAGDGCGGTCQSGSGCCTPDCSNKTCGAGDGCGGTCQSGSGCCTPDCSNKTCGAGDGCGGNCQSGSGCCTPDCSNKTCGAGDGCGGNCQSGSGCCTPDCSNKTCGAGDGCGGNCQSGSGCCTPDCSNKTCGAGDGCGGNCSFGSGCCIANGDTCSHDGDCCSNHCHRDGKCG